MMKRILFTFLAFIISNIIYAQQVSKSDMPVLKLREDSLKLLAYKIVQAREAAERFRSDSSFTRLFVRALKTPYSFNYPFDSLQTISRVYAPDSSFRIFTWQVIRDENMHRRHGAIQLKTGDGSLKLFPLIDRSFLIQNQIDTVTNHEWWVGAIYYRIVQKKHNGRDYYTLLGYDENSIRSTKKRIEVLTFNERNEPVFGGSYFSFNEDTVRKPQQARFWIEYKKDGNARMQYDDEMDMIIYDHLISENNEPSKKYTYIPDGDYEGFKWQDGQWVHIEKVFTFKLKDGEAPVGSPVTEDKLGNPAIKPPAGKTTTKPKGKSGG